MILFNTSPLFSVNAVLEAKLEEAELKSKSHLRAILLIQILVKRVKRVKPKIRIKKTKPKMRVERIKPNYFSS